MIKENPQLLPLAGSPRLTVLGSEVQLGTGYADILAVESTGRPTIIEVKLANNPEARRAIVSQVIAYAAFLYGLDVRHLERVTLQKHLGNAGYGSILEAVQAEDQDRAVDDSSFLTSLQEFLSRGHFRLVLVLDDVSVELERIVAYLDAVTLQALTIDLITLTVYQVNGVHVALPQRVTPDISRAMHVSFAGVARSSKQAPEQSDGSDAFRATTDGATAENRETFDALIRWAEGLATLPNVRLFSNIGPIFFSLSPKIMPGKSPGLVTIYNSSKQQPSVQLWRSVFERRAPNSIDLEEQAIAPVKIGQGNEVKNITPQFLNTLTVAYREAGEG